MESIDIYNKENKKNVNIGQALNLIGIILRQQGRLDEAYTYVKESLSIRIELLTDKHPDIASSLNGLAEIERDLNRYFKI